MRIAFLYQIRPTGPRSRCQQGAEKRWKYENVAQVAYPATCRRIFFPVGGFPGQVGRALSKMIAGIGRIPMVR